MKPPAKNSDSDLPMPEVPDSEPPKGMKPISNTRYRKSDGLQKSLKIPFTPFSAITRFRSTSSNNLFADDPNNDLLDYLSSLEEAAGVGHVHTPQEEGSVTESDKQSFGLGALIKKHGIVEVAKQLLNNATARERAQIAELVTADSAAGSVQDVSAPAPIMGEKDQAKFKAFATMPENVWHEADGISPARFIEQRFQNWLVLGLKIEHIDSAQPDLASAYKLEIKRNSRKRIKSLSRPHSFPAGAGRPLSAKLVAEMTPEEHEAYKERNRGYQRKFAGRKRSQLTPNAN